jgi:hypothetical protein
MEITLLIGLMFKHTIADYFTQYSWMIKDKAVYGGFGGLAHAWWHGVLTFCVLVSLTPLAFWVITALAMLDFILHYHIDYVKSNVWKDYNFGPQDQMYWVTHGVDQFAHFLTYVGIIYLCV